MVDTPRRRRIDMGKLIDIRDLLEVRREVADYEREERERFLKAFERIRPILMDLKMVIEFGGDFSIWIEGIWKNVPFFQIPIRAILGSWQTQLWGEWDIKAKIEEVQAI